VLLEHHSPCIRVRVSKEVTVTRRFQRRHYYYVAHLHQVAFAKHPRFEQTGFSNRHDFQTQLGKVDVFSRHKEVVQECDVRRICKFPRTSIKLLVKARLSLRASGIKTSFGIDPELRQCLIKMLGVGFDICEVLNRLSKNFIRKYKKCIIFKGIHR